MHERVLEENNPEAWEQISHFIFEEVQNDVDLPNKAKSISNLAYLLGVQDLEEYRLVSPVALDNGVSSVGVKEVVCQAVDYLGLGCATSFFKVINTISLARGERLSLPKQTTTMMEDRLEKGEEAQMRLFGPQVKDSAKKGAINRWLVDNCLGDHYTRKGPSDKEHEMTTFCYLAVQGVCEPQLLAHARTNAGLGNDQQFLTRIVLANVPFIDCPRSLNAINVINQVK